MGTISGLVGETEGSENQFGWIGTQLVEHVDPMFKEPQFTNGGVGVSGFSAESSLLEGNSPTL